MPGAFDWIHSGLLHQPDANEEAKRFLDAKAAENAAAVTGEAPGATPPVAPAGPPIGIAQPGQGEPQAYQTPKSWGSILMDLSQQQQQEQQFNRSLGGIFGTLSQPINRERISHTFDTTPMDPLQFGKTAMDLGSQQQGQDRVNQIAKIVNDPVQGPALAQKMGIDWEMLKAGIVTDPGMLGRVATVMATPTSGQRDLAAAREQITNDVKAAHPGWTPEQVQAEVARQAPGSSLLGNIGGYDLNDQAYRAYAAAETAAGRVPMNPIAWKTHTELTTKEKEAAVIEWPHIKQTLSINERKIDTLLGDMDHTFDAITTWKPTTGLFAANSPVFVADEKTREQAAVLAEVLADLKGSALRDVKNVRNQTEFGVLGDALTAALKPGNSKEAVRKALEAIKEKIASTRSIAREQAGMPAEEAPAPKEEPKIPKWNREKGDFE